MINFAIRYRPILDILQRQKPARVLEVGSGPEGLALFWPGEVIGADVAFKRRPLHQALAASALALPFADQSWPWLVSCDTLEHIPPALRRSAVQEMARVTADTLLLAFPSGQAAAAGYARLAQHLTSPPAWLTEHLTHGLPDALTVIGWLETAGWSVRPSWHESVEAHYRLMRWETRPVVQAITYGLMRLCGPWAAAHLPSSQKEPRLRVLLVARRNHITAKKPDSSL